MACGPFGAMLLSEPNAGLLSIRPQIIYFNEISIKIQTFSFKKMHGKELSVKSQPFYLSLNVFSRKLISVITLQTDQNSDIDG